MPSSTFSVCERAAAFWDSLRGERVMPARRDFSPAAIPDLLPHVIFFEVLDGGQDFQFRVIGSHVRRFFYANYTGERLSSLPHIDEDGPLMTSLRHVVRTGEPRREPVQYVGPLRDIYKQDEIVLPLAGDDGAVSHLLVFLDFQATVD